MRPRSASAPVPAREVTVLTAEATRESEILRGEGDAEKTRILGQAYSQDADFFGFYRSMQAYQEAMPGGNTTVVLSPNSDFFKYFGHGPGAGNRARFGVPSHTRQSEANLTSALLASHTVRLGWRFANRRAVEVLFHMRQSWLAAAAISLSILVPAAACAAPAPAQAVVPVRGAPASFADLSARLLPMVVNIATTQTLQAAMPNAPGLCRNSRPARRFQTCSRISSGRAREPAAPRHLARFGLHHRSGRATS